MNVDNSLVVNLLARIVDKSVNSPQPRLDIPKIRFNQSRQKTPILGKRLFGQ